MIKTSKDQNQELIKKEERQTKIERLRIAFTEDGAFSITDSKIEELVDLLDKKKLTAKEEERKERFRLEIAMAFGLKNGLWATNLSYSRYHEFLATTRATLIKEYNCKTPIELMLVDRIMANYWRSMRLDTTLNGGYPLN